MANDKDLCSERSKKKDNLSKSKRIPASQFISWAIITTGIRSKGGRMGKAECYVCGKEFETAEPGVPEIESWDIVVKGKKVKVQEEIRYLSEQGDEIELCHDCKENLFKQTAGFGR